MLELRSSDPQLVEKAERIFRTWPRLGTDRRRQWRVEPVRGRPDGTTVWRIDSTEPLPMTECTGRETALWLVECDAQEAFLDGHPDSVDLHGALLVRDGFAVAVVGAPEAGKSTLACAMCERGWALRSDDLVVVDPETRTARPSPRRVRLRAPSRALLGDRLWTRMAAAPTYSTFAGLHACAAADLTLHHDPDPTPLGAVLFLGRRDAAGPPAEARPVPPAHVLLALLPYSVRLSRRGLGAAISRARPIAAAVPGYDLARGPLDDMVRAIAGLVP